VRIGIGRQPVRQPNGSIKDVPLLVVELIRQTSALNDRHQRPNGARSRGGSQNHEREMANAAHLMQDNWRNRQRRAYVWTFASA